MFNQVNMYGVKWPCKDCQNRSAGCHGHCSEYKAANEQYQARRSKAKVEERLNSYAMRIASESVDRAMGRRRNEFAKRERSKGV